MQRSMYEVFLPVSLCGAALLAVIGLGCLLYCRGKNRRHLAWCAGIFISALALLFGGEVLLSLWGLTWRNLPGGVLCAIIMFSGAVGILLTLGCFLPLELPDVAPVLRWAVKGTALLSAGLVLFYALTFGTLLAVFGFGGSEQVVDYQGQALVEVEDGWLDTVYEYYEYHGPLVRGNHCLYTSPFTHIWGDSEHPG